MNTNAEYSTLIPKLTARASDMMDATFEQALKKARDPAFRSDPNAENIYARYDALDTFSANYETIRGQAIDTLLGGLVKQPRTAKLPALDDIDGLSLVGADAMDLAVASTRGIQKANESYRELLLHLELRLAELALLSGARIEPTWIHPEKIYKAIEQALSPMDLEIESKLILFGLLDGYLAGGIEKFYQAVNQLLIDGDVLASDHLMRHALKARDAARSERMPTGVHPQLPAGWAPEGSAGSSVDQAEHFDPRAGYESGLYPAIGASPQAAGSGGIDPGALGALRSYIAGEPAGSEGPAGQAPHPTATGSQPALFAAVASTRPVVQALTAVQREPSADGVPLAAEEIKGQLAAAYSGDPGRGDTWKITESEERVIDFVSQIFQGLFEDNSVSDAIKALISRLQIPIIKLALLDFNFFQHPDHPARRVLNDLVQIGIGLEDRDDPLFFRLQSIVDTILADFDTNTQPFEDALRKLAELTARDSSEAEENEVRTRQEAIRKARRSAAKRHVISTVNHYIFKKQIPDEGIQFILKCWAPYMGMLYLREGKDSQHWRDAVGALRHIIEAVQPERTRAEVEALIGKDETFFDEISDTLSESSILQEGQEGILSRFRDWFNEWFGNLLKEQTESREAAIVEGAQVPEDLPVAKIEDLLPEGDPNAGAPEDLLKDLLARIPAEVKPGSWFEIYRGEDHAKRRLKLSTILKDTGKLLFADRKGHSALEVDLAGFLNDLREGRSRLIEETSRFDRALSAVITNIRDNNLHPSAAA